MKSKLEVVEDSNLFYIGRSFLPFSGIDEIAYIKDLDGDIIYYINDKSQALTFSLKEDAIKFLERILNG